MIHIHALLLHFSMTLLSIYAVAEILRATPLKKTTWYQPVKKFLLYSGTLSLLLFVAVGEYRHFLITSSTNIHPLLVSVFSKLRMFTWLGVFVSTMMSIVYYIQGKQQSCCTHCFACTSTSSCLCVCNASETERQCCKSNTVDEDKSISKNNIFTEDIIETGNWIQESKEYDNLKAEKKQVFTSHIAETLSSSWVTIVYACIIICIVFVIAALFAMTLFDPSTDSMLMFFFGVFIV